MPIVPPTGSHPFSKPLIIIGAKRPAQPSKNVPSSEDKPSAPHAFDKRIGD